MYADFNSGSSSNEGGKNNLSCPSKGSTAKQRIQAILEYLHERELYLEELTEIRRVRLEESLQFSQLQSDANQVLRWMGNAESMLAASFLIPVSLQEAEDLQVEHEQFQLAIEVCSSLLFLLLYHSLRLTFLTYSSSVSVLFVVFSFLYSTSLSN